MDSSSGFTASPTTPAPGWALRSAEELSSEPAGGSGWSPSRGEARRFSLQSPAEKQSSSSKDRRAASIFLAEDNLADVGLIRKALEEHGIEGELLVVTDGEEAIEFIQALETQGVACPDLAIIDLNLPRRSGRDILEILRSLPACRHLPVAVLSSSDAPQDRADAIRLGANQYLPKPSGLDEFLGLGAIFKTMLDSWR